LSDFTLQVNVEVQGDCASGLRGDVMDTRTLRRHLLLSTMLASALTGYGRRAYAACVASVPPTFVCSGANANEQSINNVDDATVSTVAGFSVNTADFSAIRITGDGALSYTDTYASPLTAANRALFINSNGDVSGGNPGSVTVNTNGTLTGGYYGIFARNFGSGALHITANGDVTASNLSPLSASFGIYARTTGTDLTVTTGPGTTITSAGTGIFARRDVSANNGSLHVTVNGDVIAAGYGIRALNYAVGTDLSVTTGAGTTVTGGRTGIGAVNGGSGSLHITANGDVTGTARYGIYALNFGTDLSVTTGTGTTVTGRRGIDARNNGSGSLDVIANGDVTGLNLGISAINAGTDLNVTTGAGTTVSGGVYGIRAFGSGATTVTADGDVTATNLNSTGIYARNNAAGTDLSVTTGAGTTVTGGSNGIFARNLGSGAMDITANGDVTGTNGDGIFALNFGTDLSVTTGTGTTVIGSEGIEARNAGSGSLDVTANGDVTATRLNSTGITARNFYASSTDLNVTTGAGTTVMGAANGIEARNYGSGATTVTADGDVTGTTRLGIYALNFGTDLSVTTGTGTTVTGGNWGIFAENLGSGTLDLTANGDVMGTAFDGIFAATLGTDLAITTDAGTTVTGGRTGIYARNFGTGATTVTANGDVFGNSESAIEASNSYGDVTVTTGKGTHITGGADGINASSYAGNGLIKVTVGPDSVVTSNGANLDSFAIDTSGGPSDVTVYGTLNGGGGGAIQFDTVNAYDDRLTLMTKSSVSGDMFGGLGTDHLALEGKGTATLDVSRVHGFENASKDDKGRWVLTGTNTEITTFDMNDGVLSVNATMPATEFILNGGVLLGFGTLGTVTFNGGKFAPGNSIGTMTVNGNFALGPGTIYEVETNAKGQSDKVIVNGTVNLTGSVLRVLAEDGNYKPSTDYVIIDNDGTDPVIGKFASATSNLAFLIPTVAYAAGTGNDVVLTLERNNDLFKDVAETRNQRAVAGALDQFPTDNALFLSVLNQTAAGAREAFDALSGEIHASVAGTLVDDSRYTREAVLGRLMQASHAGDDALAADGPQVTSLYDGKSLAPLPPERAPLAFWATGFGAWADFDSDGNAASASRDLGGFLSGMDTHIGGGWRAGLATGASFSDVEVTARASAADVETYHLGGYLGGMVGDFALRGGGLWAWNSIDTSRAVIFPGFFERQKASYDADTGQLFGEVAYPTQVGTVALEPFAGLAYVSVDTENFRERGGALASLRDVNVDQEVGYTTVGLRAATTMMWGATQVIPHMSAAWQHAFDDVTPDAALAFATTGIGFTVAGIPLAEDSALLDAGFDFTLAENATAGVSYSGQFGNGVTDNAVKGRLTWLF
jgi:outer membrane autotransporter protein